MRISTQTLYAQSMLALNHQQGSLVHLGQQIASGLRVVRPSDDPLAASQALRVDQASAVNGQYTATRTSARNALSMEESVLGSVGDAITSAKTLVLAAANGTLSDADRASIASQLQGILDTVLGQANATDGNGRYLFGGYQDGTAPFGPGPGGAIGYNGSDQVRELQVDASRRMPVQDTGASVFQGAQGATGFMAVAGDNSGTLTTKPPVVVDASDPNYGTAFKIDFSFDGGGNAMYAIESPDGSVLQAAQPFVAGSAIQYAGLSVTLDGAPEAGDSVTVGQTRNMDIDVFATFQKVLDVLGQPADTPAKKAALQNTLGNAMTAFDTSLDNVLMVRASVGSRLDELDVVDKVAGDRKINYAQTKSDLVDLDYTAAISEYSLRQIGLQAAQKAFLSMTQMNLFDLL